MKTRQIFTIRNKQGDIIAIADTDDLLVEEICAVCKKQGIIYHVHPESEEHKGSPNFKPWKPTPEFYRRIADELAEMQKPAETAEVQLAGKENHQ